MRKSSKPAGPSKNFKLNLLGENIGLQFTGSKLGKIFHKFATLLLIYVSLIDLQSFYYNHNDEYITQIQAHGNSYAANNVKIHDTILMPYIEVRKWKSFNSTKFDIYKNGTNTEIDFLKLSQYLKIYLNVNEITPQYRRNFQRSLRTCNQEDFSKRGYVDETLIPENMLCPDMDMYSDDYTLRNTYNKLKDKTQFSFEYHTCLPEQQSDCKSEAEIKDLLNHLYFNLYVLEENIELEDLSNYGQKPVSLQSNFMEQFKLDFDRTSFSFYNVRLNNIKTKDNQWAIYSSYQSYKYINTYLQNKYSADYWVTTNSNSTSDGVNYFSLTKRIVYAQYFVIDNKRESSTRNVYTFFHCLSKIGGIRNIILLLTLYFTKEMNYNILMGTFIMNLFYPKDTNNKQKSRQNHNRHSLDFKFSFWDKCKTVWWIKPFKYLLKSKKYDNTVYFDNLKKSVEDQINMVNIVTRLQKVAIMVSIIMSQDQFKDLKEKSEEQYYNYINQIHDDENKTQNNVLYNYLDKFGQDKIKSEHKKKIVHSLSVKTDLDGSRRNRILRQSTPEMEESLYQQKKNEKSTKNIKVKSSVQKTNQDESVELNDQFLQVTVGKQQNDQFETNQMNEIEATNWGNQINPGLSAYDFQNNEVDTNWQNQISPMLSTFDVQTEQKY